MNHSPRIPELVCILYILICCVPETFYLRNIKKLGDAFHHFYVHLSDKAFFVRVFRVIWVPKESNLNPPLAMCAVGGSVGLVGPSALGGSPRGRVPTRATLTRCVNASSIGRMTRNDPSPPRGGYHPLDVFRGSGRLSRVQPKLSRDNFPGSGMGVCPKKKKPEWLRGYLKSCKPAYFWVELSFHHYLTLCFIKEMFFLGVGVN